MTTSQGPSKRTKGVRVVLGVFGANVVDVGFEDVVAAEELAGRVGLIQAKG